MFAVGCDTPCSSALRCCIVSSVARGVALPAPGKAQPLGAALRSCRTSLRPCFSCGGPETMLDGAAGGSSAGRATVAAAAGATVASAGVALAAFGRRGKGRSLALATVGLDGSMCRCHRRLPRDSWAPEVRGATTLAASSRSLPSFNFSSPCLDEPVGDSSSSSPGALPPMPPMSKDGGSEEEFQVYWRRNRKPRLCGDGWIERLAHPQVNIEPYWYNPDFDEYRWLPPDGVTSAEQPPDDVDLDGGGEIDDNDGLEELAGEGPVWEMNVPELKEIMATGRTQEAGLEIDELARRAVAIYEQFTPRVLSWHDFQHLTFWFFGGRDNQEQEKGGKGGKGRGKGQGRGAFFRGKGAGRELFAERAFFVAASKVLKERLHRMHPICLTYFVWTFSRAEVVIPGFMSAVGDHLCKGRLPMMDRCALGTMVWNYQKQGVAHDRLFEVAAAELSRPNRLRSLAPRNFQNTMIAYGRRRHWNARLLGNLSRGIRRLLDAHEPQLAKLDNALCFPYTCRDGSVVLADSFRINGLTVILKMYHRMPVASASSQACITSMIDYVWRGLQRARLTREPGDACEFFTVLGRLLRDAPDFFGDAQAAEQLLPSPDSEEFGRICWKASGPQEKALEQALQEAAASLAQLQRDQTEQGSPVQSRLSRPSSRPSRKVSA